MKIQVVIGTNYGDEGKGRMVSFLASKNPNSIIVRFNGGSQAAHRCVVDGTAHIFKHFGAGTLSGCRTFLTKDFIINPIMFFEELDVLNKKGFFPKVMFDNCSVTTPYDMMLNQWIEEDRGDNRHGSCGLGINETVTRQQNSEFALSVFDLLSPRFDDIVKNIRDNYVAKRCNQLNMVLTEERSSILYDNRITDNFIMQCYNLLNYEGTKILSMVDLFNLVSKKWLPDNLIFEGAQGLLLDQTFGTFPHVTRSNTGLTNISKYLERYCSKHVDIEVHYVTRCYFTRHGNGPFVEDVNFPQIYDPCNQPNPWQGTMRFGCLDGDILLNALLVDSKLLVERGFTNIQFNLNITCLDQMNEYKLIHANVVKHFFSDYNFIHALEDIVSPVATIKYLSYSDHGDMNVWGKHEQKEQSGETVSV